MDFYLQKAKVFATETARVSQEFANQAARLSQSLAAETSKRSKELAVDIVKKADELKTYAGELTPTIATKVTGEELPVRPSQEELEEHSITPELLEYVEGLTIKTFVDFPVESDEEGSVYQTGKQDLSPWREKHAALLLLVAKKIAKFRYVLCPRRMTESRFWKIYFTLVTPQISGCEERAVENAARVAVRERTSQIGPVDARAKETATRDLETSVAPPPQEIAGGENASSSVQPKSENNDLDDYLMGNLGSSDAESGGDDFDEDFDQLVNSTVDSDAEP